MMKLVFSACLLIHSVAAFARPFPFWGRGQGVASAAEALSSSTTNTCLQQATTPSDTTVDDSTTAITTKPLAIVDAANWELLSARGQAALERLIQADDGIGAQTHVYGDWPPAGTDDDGKKRLTEQVRKLL